MTVTCVACGRNADGEPLEWSHHTTDRVDGWLCPDCTRAHLRSIEAGLDAEWW